MQYFRLKQVEATNQRLFNIFEICNKKHEYEAIKICLTFIVQFLIVI